LWPSVARAYISRIPLRAKPSLKSASNSVPEEHAMAVNVIVSLEPTAHCHSSIVWLRVWHRSKEPWLCRRADRRPMCSLHTVVAHHCMIRAPSTAPLRSVNSNVLGVGAVLVEDSMQNDTGSWHVNISARGTVIRICMSVSSASSLHKDRIYTSEAIEDTIDLLQMTHEAYIT